MRTKAIVRLSLLLLVPVHGTRAQVPVNVLFNVFQIRVPGKTGTAFTMKVEGRQYLITAKHMVHDLRTDGSPQSIEVRKLTESASSLRWERLTVRVFTCDDPVDIAVLVTAELVRQSAALEARPDGMPLGQEGYFLGFPLGYASPTKGPNSPFPIPFVKRGSLSTIFYSITADEMIFDGYNNPGFSGGPVVYEDRADQNPNRSHFYVAGVVSGFIPELVNAANWRRARPQETLTGIEKWRIQQRQDGHTYVLEDTATVVPLNTGIINAFNIHHAVDLIKAHPIGPLTP